MDGTNLPVRNDELILQMIERNIVSGFCNGTGIDIKTESFFDTQANRGNCQNARPGADVQHGAVFIQPFRAHLL